MRDERLNEINLHDNPRWRKRPEPRDKRIASAIEWIAEGKQRNWKYQNC
jgi:hypothetical protein